MGLPEIVMTVPFLAATSWIGSARAEFLALLMSHLIAISQKAGKPSLTRTQAVGKMLNLIFLSSWQVVVFHPSCGMRAACVVALQNRIHDWSRIGHRSAVVKSMHVRARGRKWPQKLAIVNKNQTEDE